MKNYSISIYFDKRRIKENGNYPIRLQVYTSNPKNRKRYATKIEATEEEYEGAFGSSKVRKQYKWLKVTVDALTSKAEKIAKDLDPFTFDQFEKKMFRMIGQGCKVEFQYNEVIDEYNKNGQVGTAQSYLDSKRSLIRFCREVKKTKFEKLIFTDITKEWLLDYERFMLNTLDRSITTVGIYLRPLRALFNKAISEKEIEVDFYPFGKRKYQIPTKKNKKKALNTDQLKGLFEAIPANESQEKAKDFWFFTYACNGINMKDILLLKYSDIENDKIEFVRAKTKLTTKGNQKTITFYLNDFSKSIIDKYGNENTSPDTLVFDVLNGVTKPIDKLKKVKNFTQFVNKNMQKLCLANELPKISTYWARHTFATQSIRKGASMEFMQESLGHKDMKTTMSYFAGFDSNTKKDFADQLMNFE